MSNIPSDCLFFSRKTSIVGSTCLIILPIHIRKYNQKKKKQKKKQNRNSPSNPIWLKKKVGRNEIILFITERKDGIRQVQPHERTLNLKRDSLIISTSLSSLPCLRWVSNEPNLFAVGFNQTLKKSQSSRKCRKCGRNWIRSDSNCEMHCWVLIEGCCTRIYLVYIQQWLSHWNRLWK